MYGIEMYRIYAITKTGVNIVDGKWQTIFVAYVSYIRIRHESVMGQEPQLWLRQEPVFDLAGGLIHQQFSVHHSDHSTQVIFL